MHMRESSRIRKRGALEVPGVAACTRGRTCRGAVHHRHPRRLPCRSQRHVHARQRGAFCRAARSAVVADTEGAAEEGCRKVEIDYEVLPAVFDPEEAMRPGAPVIHDKGANRASGRPGRNILLEIHGEVGDVEDGFKEADVIHEGAYTTHRVQHVHLETHCSITWLDNGRLNVRTSSQTPHITKQKLWLPLRSAAGQRPRLLRERRRRIRRQAGSADRRYLRVCHHSRLGRPVKLEFTREEEFIGATTRHPMRATDESRRQARRDADCFSDARCLQHRRLRQSRWRNAVRRMRRSSGGISLRE